MHSRRLQGLFACTVLGLIALCYGALSGQVIDIARVLLWSGVGVSSYITLSQWFGFDPHRTTLGRYAPALSHYLDRWELRLGQATLSMLGCVVLAACILERDSFVTALVSAVSAAWIYFLVRLYVGSYTHAPTDGARSSR